MNLTKDFTIKEQKLLNDAGIKIEDKECTNEELRKCIVNVEDFIMSHSSKNGDILRLSDKYDKILKTLNR